MKKNLKKKTILQRMVHSPVLLALTILTVVLVSTYQNYHNSGFNENIASDKMQNFQEFFPRDLNEIKENNPLNPVIRLRPQRIQVSPIMHKAYITLMGTESKPGNQVLVVDLKSNLISGRIVVGKSPFGLRLNSDESELIVTNRFSNYLSVVSTKEEKEVRKIEVPFYSEDIEFSKDERFIFVSNFYKNQVLLIDYHSGKILPIGTYHNDFFGKTKKQFTQNHVCKRCGWTSESDTKCKQCGHQMVAPQVEIEEIVEIGASHAIRASCGTVNCHLHQVGGFYAGPDLEKLQISSRAHAFFGHANSSPLLKSVLSIKDGGWADRKDGRHHKGGVIFKSPANDIFYKKIWNWIDNNQEGPGISVGQFPRDMTLSEDGKWLYVANTGSLDISVVSIEKQKEVRRIFTRSPVNDLVIFKQNLILATLGIGSGHPKKRDKNKESTDLTQKETELTLYRDLNTGKPLPPEKQAPLGPYNEVDGTSQEKFRDITNDIVVLNQNVSNVAKYQASNAYTRYTSDTFESLNGDKKNNVPNDLMKVVGAFPEQIHRIGDKIYVTMSGTFQVQEWEINNKKIPQKKLKPSRVFQTEFKPIGISHYENKLLVVNSLSDSLSIIDLDKNTVASFSLDERNTLKYPANDFEKGEFFVQTSVFSIDQDQSCVHCHYRDTSDGKAWSVSQVMGQSRNGEERTGGSRVVPDIRNLMEKVPFFLEGTLSIDEPLTMMMEHNPLGDFIGKTPSGNFDHIFSTDKGQLLSADSLVTVSKKNLSTLRVNIHDLIKRRETHFENISRKYLGKAYSFREFQKFIGTYQKGASRLLPNPFDKNEEMIKHGKYIFESPLVGCTGCHPAPTFSDKINVYNENKAFPPLISPTFRDNVHTLISADRIDYISGYTRDWDRDDRGRVEGNEGFFVAPSLRGLWARPARFLHHGQALSLREALSVPGHISLRPINFLTPDINRENNIEKGFNELNGLFDLHGVTSGLSQWDMECLIAFIKSLE